MPWWDRCSAPFVESTSRVSERFLRAELELTRQVLEARRLARERTGRTGLDDVVAGEELASLGIELTLYDGRAMPLPDACVDAAWVWDVMEHVR